MDHRIDLRIDRGSPCECLVEQFGRRDLPRAHEFRQPERVLYNPHDPYEIWVTSFGNGLNVGRVDPPPITNDLWRDVEAVRGVDEAIPILSQFVILDLHGKKQPTYLVGYDPDQGGGPWELIAGRHPRTKREMVFDRVLATRHGLKLGDVVEVLGKDFSIVGLSNGTTSWMTSFFFLRKEAAEDLLLSPGATSYLLVTTSTGANLDDLMKRLNALSGVNALAKTEMAANDLKLFARVFSAPLKLMVGIALLDGTMIVGLVIYTITVERQLPSAPPTGRTSRPACPPTLPHW